MTTEKELREKLRKIAAIFEGATTSGERDEQQPPANVCLPLWALRKRWKRRLKCSSDFQIVGAAGFLPRCAAVTISSRIAIRASASPRWWCGLRGHSSKTRCGPSTWRSKQLWTPTSTKQQNESSAKRYSGMLTKRKNARDKPAAISRENTNPAERRRTSRRLPYLRRIAFHRPRT